MTRPAALGLDLDGSGAPAAVQAVVFDCDGLLVDSESCWLEIVADALGARGLAADAAALAPYAGLTIADAAARLADDDGTSAGGDAALGAAVLELRDRYTARLEAGVATMPGAVALVEALAARRIPIAVASNGDRDHVRALLEGAGLAHRFDAMVTADDVDRGKPHPEPYERATALLGAAPERTLAADDTAIGAAAALAAGLRVAAVNADPAVALPGHLRLTTLVELADRLGLRAAH
ncbi:MAG: HAD family phosphatase [Microbacteriaceae bacterium]|nr:HAD family phosphatase [Microbacteriaceae bacterium]